MTLVYGENRSYGESCFLGRLKPAHSVSSPVLRETSPRRTRPVLHGENRCSDLVESLDHGFFRRRYGRWEWNTRGLSRRVKLAEHVCLQPGPPPPGRAVVRAHDLGLIKQRRRKALCQPARHRDHWGHWSREWGSKLWGQKNSPKKNNWSSPGFFF